MPTLYIDKELKDRCYFITITVVDWIDIFTFESYFLLLISILKYYQLHNKLRLYGYVFMTNHIHLIAQCSDMVKFLKGFKSFSTMQVKLLIKQDNRLYLKNLILKAKLNQRREKYSIWNYKNWPVLVESDYFFEQKLNYIHNNPVVKGFVEDPTDWKYSSARNYELNDHRILRIDTTGELD
ncbi:MAG: transposase [Candidatus Dojkabacteria bacterium]|nr:transposase [Candidatus Dojkabacteria bacterium]